MSKSGSKSRRKVQKRIRLGIRLLFVLMLVSGVAAAGANPAQRALQQKKLLDSEEQKLAALKEQNAQLEERLQRLSDPGYIETLAREELGVIRPGEIPHVVEPGPVLPPPPKPSPKPKPFYEKAWDWVKTLVT